MLYQSMQFRQNFKDWTAWFGSGSQDDFKFERNNENVQTSEIHAMIKPHPKWDPDSYARDIMLFKLKKQIQFTGRIFFKDNLLMILI